MTVRPDRMPYLGVAVSAHVLLIIITYIDCLVKFAEVVKLRYDCFIPKNLRILLFCSMMHFASGRVRRKTVSLGFRKNAGFSEKFHLTEQVAVKIA